MAVERVTRTEELSDAAIAEAYERYGFRVEHAARALRVSRAHLYVRLQSCAGVVRASDLTADAIVHARLQAGGDVRAAADRLRVSRRALLLQMKRLKLSV